MTISLPVVGRVGAQRPRVSSVPPSVTSSGGEAVELAAAAGLVLDPWQAWVLEQSLGERQDGKWSAFEVGLVVPRQNGKGSVLEARELAGLFLFGEQLILHSAHEFKTAQEAFRRILGLVQNTPDLDKQVQRVRTSHGEEGIELRSGARLRFVARSTGSGRGFSGDCVILDEAYNLPQEAMAALLPTMSARQNPQLWYASSAGMESSEVLARVRERGTEGGKRLAYFEWSANAGCDLDDADEWAAANPSMNVSDTHGVTDEFVESERGALGDAEFARERLGIWADPRRHAVIPPDAWAACADPTSEIDGPFVFSVDISPDREWASVASCGVRADGLEHGEVIANRRSDEWVLSRLADLYAKWRSPVFLDPAGPAGSLIPELEQRRIKYHAITSREMGQACGAFYDSVMEGRFKHLDDPRLNIALSVARKRTLGDAWAWHRRDTLADISPLVAVTLARFGYAQYGAKRRNRSPAKVVVA